MRIVDLGSIEEVVQALESGGTAVIPTDTVYGLAAKAANEGAVRRVFAAKGRPLDKAMAVLVDSFESARALATFDEEAAELAARDWPGSLTLVLPRTQNSGSLFLGGDPATIGLRIPDDSFCLALIERVGPLAATSANPSGDRTGHSVEEIAKVLEADIYVEGGRRQAAPSTVISLVGELKKLR